MDLPEVVLTSDQTYGDGEQAAKLTPLEEILDLMGTVAEGASVVALREAVARSYPDNIKEAETWQIILNRLKQASEVVAGVGTESFAALVNH
jgi:hypothetical protein